MGWIGYWAAHWEKEHVEWSVVYQAAKKGVAGNSGYASESNIML